MQIKIIVSLAALALISLGSCDRANKEKKKEAERSIAILRKKHTEVKDAHGCISSAGYIWSAAKNDCIRLWESGAELVPTNKSELVVYVVVTDDKKKAEIFIPGDTSFVLAGSGNGTYSNDTLTLSTVGKSYMLKQNGKAIYQTETLPVEEETKQVKKKKRRR